MTEIKRSFYLLLAFMAVLLLFPLMKSARAVNKVSSDFGVSHIVVSNVVASTVDRVDPAVYESANGIHKLAVRGVKESPQTVCDNATLPLSEVPYSVSYKIATTEANTVEITKAERDMIAATCQLEVLGRYSTVEQFENPGLKYYELLAVAQIIKNRLSNEYFPDDIKTIIYDSGYTAKGKVYQFSTSPDVKYTNPTDLAYAAVDEVFANGVNVLPEDYLYFCASWRESGFEVNNRSVLKFLGDFGDFDKIVADATTFYAGVTIRENQANGYVF